MKYLMNDIEISQKKFDELLLETCDKNHMKFENQLYDLKHHGVTLIIPHKEIKFQIISK